MRCIKSSRFVGIVAALLFLESSIYAGAIGSAFDPNDFTAIQATLNAGPSDSLVFDTNLMTLSINSGPALNGVEGTTQSPVYKAKLAVFTFGAIDIDPAATISIVGGYWLRGLVLASHSDLNFGATLDVSGTDAFYGTAGVGGRGSDQGSNGLPNSAPPSLGAGYGGAGSHLGLPGSGIGAGSPPNKAGSGGAGASYGGHGGWGRWLRGNSSSPGPVYGDALLTDLFGGSGGGGGNGVNNYGGGGGGGGGSLELVAVDTLTLSGSLLANGGDGGWGYESGGGGGSGGGILLAGNNIDFSGTVSATGGVGGIGSVYKNDGGGGGGGRVAFYARTSLVDNGVIDVAGGTAPVNAGQAGSIHKEILVPEPSAMILIIIGALILPVCIRRRKN